MHDVMIKTPQQILIELSALIADEWGATPLVNPVANRGSNLVRLLTGSAIGLSKMQERFESALANQYIDQLEGCELTAAAQVRGLIRKSDTKSKYTIIATGNECGFIPKDTKLSDSFGAKWSVISDIEMTSMNGCYVGQGVACADDAGTQTLLDGELSLIDEIAGVNSVTNGLLLELGGALESDQSLRNRLFNKGALSAIVGTEDYLLTALYAIDNVNFARIKRLNDCNNMSGLMIVVHGGDNQEICNTIEQQFKHGSGVLLGDTSCPSSCVSGIKYQEACPVIIEVMITLACDCPVLSKASIITAIMKNASKIAQQITVKNCIVGCGVEGVDRIEVRKKKMPLATCSQGEITDPFTNQEIDMTVDSGCSICGHEDNCPSEFAGSTKLNVWEYGILDTNHIYFTDNCAESDGC